MFGQNRLGELSRTVFKLLACVGERERMMNSLDKVYSRVVRNPSRHIDSCDAVR